MSSDVSKWCRLCLKEGQVSFNIFNDLESSNPSITDQIVECFQIQLLDTPGWPRSACTSCVATLNEMRTLKVTILASHSRLFESVKWPKEEISETYSAVDDPFSSQDTPVDVEIIPVKMDLDEEEYIIEESSAVTTDPNEYPTADGLEEEEEKEVEEDISTSTVTSKRTRRKMVALKLPKLKRREERAKLENEEPALVETMRTMDLLRCSECQTSTDSLRELFAHLKTVHNQPRGFIFCCDRKKFGRGPAFDHVRLHLDKDAFKCQICEQRYPARWHLDYHIKQVHTPAAERQFVCDVCGKSFANRSGFEDHVKYHIAPEDRPYKCSTCGHGFTAPYQLKRHILRMHEKSNDFICEDCGKGFATSSLLSSHRFKNHRDKRQDPLRTGCKYIRCEVCDKRVSERNYQAHMANKCFQEGVAMVCIFCNRKLKTPKSLKAHMRLIHPDRDNGLTCPHCPFLPATAGNRMRHIKNAHPAEFEKLKYTIRDEEDDVLIETQ